MGTRRRKDANGVIPTFTITAISGPFVGTLLNIGTAGSSFQPVLRLRPEASSSDTPSMNSVVISTLYYGLPYTNQVRSHFGLQD